MGVTSYARDARFLGFHQCRSGSAEGIEDDVFAVQSKSTHVPPDQVRGEREDKTVPAVDRQVLFLNGVDGARA
jgi:hypothetical protein